jgi:hypothetical protein
MFRHCMNISEVVVGHEWAVSFLFQYVVTIMWIFLLFCVVMWIEVYYTTVYLPLNIYARYSWEMELNFGVDELLDEM